MLFAFAERADLPAIVDIYNGTISSRMVTADLNPVTAEERLPWFESHTPDRRPIWVAKRGGELLAWASLGDFYGRPAYNGTAELSVYVAEAARGTGVGTRIVQHVFAECPRLRVNTILGFVFAHNAPSIGLLRKLGFEQWGYYPEVAELDGVLRDLAILGIKIESEEKPNESGIGK
ncbi:N-acetyltransferase [Cohnella fermenti]|uniref:N-acetyltransferase n=1 Tax=Cohnella fermenti TaxID=2565925 RepID=A0A4S4C080_9BACL|nr:N-acetyltransferase [Cohnella fermenti]